MASVRRLQVVGAALCPAPAAAATWAELLAKYPNPESLVPHPGWDAQFLYVNGVRLRVWRTPGGTRPDGSPKPVIVLSHGMGKTGSRGGFFWES